LHIYTRERNDFQLNLIKAKIQDIAKNRADLSEQIPCRQKDEIGKVARWFNILTAKLGIILDDIREAESRVRSESEKFKAMAHWYESILDAIPFLVSVLNTEMKWSFVNTPVEKMLGKERKDIVGLNCGDWGLSICNTGNCAVSCAKREVKQVRFKHDGVSYQVNKVSCRGHERPHRETD